MTPPLPGCSAPPSPGGFFAGSPGSPGGSPVGATADKCTTSLTRSSAAKRRPREWHVPASQIARNTHNYIRSIVENMCIEPNPDKEMIALSIGDPTVFGNFVPPAEVFDAVKDSLLSCKYNGYAPSSGYQQAREAVARYSSVDGVTVDPQDVVLCSGCSCALDLAITVLANPGQNILVPRPGFSIYRTLAEGLGIRTKPYNLLAERGWEADLAGLEAAIDEDTAAIVVNNPSNPCGSVFSKQHLRDILDIASRHRVPIIGDEIYEHLVFPGERYYSLGSLSEDVPILSCSGLTKRFLVPGWRMGWVVLHDRAGVLGREVRGGLQRLSQRIIGSNTLVQGALADILERTPQAFYDQTVCTLQAHARLAYDELSRVPGLRPVMPQGAMYMMVGIDMAMFPEFGTDLELVNQLVCEESVFVLPGQCFDFPGYVRLVLTVPEPQLRAACSRIRSFCARHHKAHGSTDVDMDSQELPYLQTLQDMEVLDVDELDLSPRGADTFPNDSRPGAVGVGGSQT